MKINLSIWESFIFINKFLVIIIEEVTIQPALKIPVAIELPK
jgi:hypothetical protein